MPAKTLGVLCDPTLMEEKNTCRGPLVSKGGGLCDPTSIGERNRCRRP